MTSSTGKHFAATGGAKPHPYPILKWAGGKSQLLPVFDLHLPKQFNRYFEPFVGGGAMFFHLYGKQVLDSATLSDLNDELINCYSVVRDNVDLLIKQLKKHRNESDYFYDLRALDVNKLSDIERAARIIYLNKTCFNGLYRVNSRGEFNVPFGSYKNPRTCDENNLRAAAIAFRSVKLRRAPFTDVLKRAEKGDFIYFDPPYQPLSATSNFTSYTRQSFGERDQELLAEMVDTLDRRGCKIMLSNSDNEFIRSLYDGLNIETVYATRAINCKGSGRGRITEVLITNY